MCLRRNVWRSIFWAVNLSRCIIALARYYGFISSSSNSAENRETSGAVNQTVKWFAGMELKWNPQQLRHFSHRQQEVMKGEGEGEEAKMKTMTIKGSYLNHTSFFLYLGPDLLFFLATFSPLLSVFFFLIYCNRWFTVTRLFSVCPCYSALDFLRRSTVRHT